jgi:3-deoxy-7-phosphoheptulonate synthase
MVDVHADPTAALCDGPQALYCDELELLAAACRDLPPVVGRRGAG